MEVIERRLKNAEKEMSRRGMYMHVIVNDSLQEAVAELVLIVERYGKGVRRKAQKRKG